MNFFLIWFIKLFFPKYWMLSSALVYAQAKHETGNFKSAVYRENKNLFGMKRSTRPFEFSENRGHASYHSSVLSIIDYYKRQLQFEIFTTNVNSYINETFQSNYAEDPNYKVKWFDTYNSLPFVYRVIPFLVTPTLLLAIYWISKGKVTFPFK